MKRHAFYLVFSLIFVAASCELLDPYEGTAPTYEELNQEVDSLFLEVAKQREALEYLRQAIEIQSEYTVKTDSVILERLKYLYSR